MIESKRHRIDPREIFVVKQVLLARQSPALSTEISCKRTDHRVENRDDRHLYAAAAFLQQQAKRLADQGR